MIEEALTSCVGANTDYKITIISLVILSCTQIIMIFAMRAQLWQVSKCVVDFIKIQIEQNQSVGQCIGLWTKILDEGKRIHDENELTAKGGKDD
jgi:hypothetical protein